MKNQEGIDQGDSIILDEHALIMAEKLLKERAQGRVQNERAQNESLQSSHESLRLYIEGKGCDGFFYGVAFDEEKPGDIHFQQGSSSIDLLVDQDTLEFVKGSKIIWVDDERGKGFLVLNPYHKKFRGKFFKRSAWTKKLQEKLEQKPSTS